MTIQIKPKHICIHPSAARGSYYNIRQPSNSETIAYDAVHNIGKKPSVFAPKFTVTDSSLSFTSCPSCEDELPEMKHGTYCKCGECGLEMELFGNGLSIWRTA